MYHLFVFIFQFIFLCTGKFSVHLRFYLHLIAGFNMYRPYLFSSPYFCAVKVFHLFVEFIQSGCLVGSPGAGRCRFVEGIRTL